MKKFKKDWERIDSLNYEEVVKKVKSIFARWERENLQITRGRKERNISETYGLPYTSSGVCAGLGLHCNVNAVLKSDPNFTAYELMITEENEIVVYLTDAEENEKYIIIGIL